jgi:hypothetical protein
MFFVLCCVISLCFICDICFTLALNHLQIKSCKHGDFLLSTQDNHVSRHLLIYGEWAEYELELFLQIIKPGDIVLDVGANIGN